MIEIEGYELIENYAKRVNYSVSMIRKLIKKKELKHRKFKRRVYVWIG